MQDQEPETIQDGALVDNLVDLLGELTLARKQIVDFKAQLTQADPVDAGS